MNVPARSSLAVVFPDGTVSYYPHCIFKSACSIDVTNFPFDQQKCNLAFGSWTHTAREVVLDMAFPEGIDVSTYNKEQKDSSTWDIVNLTANNAVMPSEDEYPNYSVITFEMLIKRKVVFSTYLLTLPCVFLACLTLVVFWLPPERPDRTTLGKMVALLLFGNLGTYQGWSQIQKYLYLKVFEYFSKVFVFDTCRMQSVCICI